MTSFADKILGLHRSLQASGLPYALGGALALGWCTRDPRATSDIDLNIFVEAEQYKLALAALPVEVTRPAAQVRQLARDGQTRLRWEATPVDVFLVNTKFHAGVAGRCQVQMFEGEHIPYLSCSDLAVFKAYFDRSKDWADLEEMAVSGAFDIHEVAVTLAGLLGADDPRIARILRLPGRPLP